jgi:hypothetical protein
MKIFLLLAQLLAVFVAAQTTTSTYEPPTYSPSSTVTTLHNTPRLVGSNQFEGLDVTGDYYIGLVITGTFFFLAAILIPLGFLCRGFCRLCSKEEASQERGKCFRITYMCMCFLGFIMVSTTLGANDSIDSAVNSFAGDVNDLGGLIDTATEEVDTFLVANAEATTAAEAIECPEVPAQDKTDFINGLIALDAYANDFLNLTDGMSANLYGFKDDMQYYNGNRSITSILAILGVYAIIVLAILFTILELCVKHAGKCARCLICCVGDGLMLPFGVFVLMCFCITAGITLIFSVAASDICIDPDVNLLSITPSSSNATAAYFITCEGYNPLKSDLDNITTGLEDSLSKVAEIRALLVASSDSNCNDEVSEADALSAALDDSLVVVGDATDLILCSSINPLYSSFVYDSLCTSAVDASTLAWTSCAVASLSLLVILSLFDSVTKESMDERSDDVNMSPRSPGSESNAVHRYTSGASGV